MGESAESLFNRGLDNHDRENFEEAIACYKAAIELDPGLVVAHNNLGMVYIDTNQLDDAIVQLSRTLQLDPAYGEAYNNLGFVYRRLGQDVNAATCYARFLELEPDVEEAPKIRSWTEQVSAANGGLYDVDALIGLGQPEPQPEPEPQPVLQPQPEPVPQPEAQPVIDESIFGARTMVMGQGIGPAAESADSLCERGVGEFERGDLDAAEATLKRAVEIDSKLAIARSTLGRVLAKSGRFEEAVEELRQAIGLDPNDAAAFYVLGFSLRSLGWDEDAAAAYEQYLDLTPDAAEAAQIRSWIAEVHENLGPQQMNPDELYGHAVQHFNEGLLDEAMEALEHALSLDETHAASALLLGRILVDKEDLIRAVPILKRAERLQGDNPEIHYYIGSAYEKRGMPEEAQASYARCLELNPPKDIADYARSFLEKQRGSKSRQLNSATRCEYCFRPFPAENLSNYQGKKICRDCQGNLGLGPAAKPAQAIVPDVAADKPSESQARRMKPRRSRRLAAVVLLGAPLVLAVAFLGVLKSGKMSSQFQEWGMHDALAGAGLREPLSRFNIAFVTKAEAEAARAEEQRRRIEALKVPVPVASEPLAAAAKMAVAKVMPGKSVSFELTASGGKGAYSFSLEEAPAGMDIDKATGLVTWTAPVSAAATRQRATVKVACEEEEVLIELTVVVGFGYRLGRELETDIQPGDRIHMAVGNLNASGGRKLDDIVVVWGNYRRGQMGIFYQQAAAETFSSMARTELDGVAGALLVADLSGDGRNEVVVANWFSSKLVMFKQTAQGLLAKEQELPSGRGVDFLAAGSRELFASHWAEPALYRYTWDEAQGSKLLARPAVYPTNSQSGWNRLFVGPYGGGGRSGVLLACGSGGTPLKFFAAKIDGSLDFYAIPEPENLLTEHPVDVVSVKFGEGSMALAALFGGERPRIEIIRSSPEGLKLAPTGIKLDEDAIAIAAADLNGDGLDDIVVVHPGHLAIFLAADADGASFGRAAKVEVPGLMGPVAFGAFARDGQKDMLVLRDGGKLQVIRASHFAEGGE